MPVNSSEILHPAFEFTPEFEARVVSDREYLHRHPELSLAEFRTVEFLSNRLKQIGLETYQFGETGLVGVLRNGNGPVVAYRADTDGLPVEEQTGLDFASDTRSTIGGKEVPVMHACGHDIHMAVALGVASRLAATTDFWAGTVVFIFQPAEEIAAGAKLMIEAGLWNEVSKPEIVYGLHVMPYETGKIFVPIGSAMSMADSWKITVLGRGAHGSQPEQSIDPIVIAASTILRLQSIISREVSPREIAVLTVGTFHAGLKENIIPDRAEFSVNVRTFKPEIRQQILEAIRRIVEAEAAAGGAPMPLIETISEFPECYNDIDESRSVIETINSTLGPEIAHEIVPHMASEDFGLLASSIDVPSVYWFLGGIPKESLDGDEQVPVNHSPFFAPVSNPTLTTGVRGSLAVLLSKLEILH